MFFILAVLGLEVFGVILAGYASASKWSLFGAMREAAQVVSYEVPLGMCVVVPVLIAGTMDLVTIGQMQAGWFTNWFIFHDPFTFIIVLGLLHLRHGQRQPRAVRPGRGRKRAGGRLSHRILRLPLELLLHGRVRLDVRRQRPGRHPVLRRLERARCRSPQWLGLADATNPLLHYLGNLLGLFNFIGKCVFGVTFMMWVRWTLPRLRIDQVMTTCLKYCMPIAAVMFVGAVLWTYFVPGGLVVLPGTPLRTGARGPDDRSAISAPPKLTIASPSDAAPVATISTANKQVTQRGTDQLDIRSSSCCSPCWPAASPSPWC